MLRANSHPNTHLQSSWNKYGESSFNFKIVENVEALNLIPREQTYLDIARFEPHKCYNQSFVAGKVEFTPELRKKLSLIHSARLSRKENNNRYGKHHTEESKRKMSLSHKGKHLTDSAKQKISGERSVAHRLDVKEKKKKWWENLRENKEKYKLFCKNRAIKSVKSRLRNRISL